MAGIKIRDENGILHECVTCDHFTTSHGHSTFTFRGQDLDESEVLEETIFFEIPYEAVKYLKRDNIAGEVTVFLKGFKK